MLLTTEKIASITNAEIGSVTKESFSSFASLHKAHPHSISFSTATQPGVTFTHSQAGCVLVPHHYKELPSSLFKNKTILYCNSPYHAIITLLEEFYPQANTLKAIHPSATIHDSAVIEGEIEAQCVIGPNCVVMEGALVEAGAILEANVTVYPGVVIGEKCVIQAGVVIGSRGFGFYEHEGNQKVVPHFGGVSIGSQSTIGANSVIASGFIESTTIGTHCHLDSFVQIGHNCSLGNNCFMVSQSGVAGSTTICNNVSVGGGAQIAGHLTIGEQVTIAAKSGVTKSIAPKKTVAGFPAIDIVDWRKIIIEQRQNLK